MSRLLRHIDEQALHLLGCAGLKQSLYKFRTQSSKTLHYVIDIQQRYGRFRKVQTFKYSPLWRRYQKNVSIHVQRLNALPIITQK